MLPPSLRSYARNHIQYFLFQAHQSRVDSGTDRMVL